MEKAYLRQPPEVGQTGQQLLRGQLPANAAHGDALEGIAVTFTLHTPQGINKDPTVQ